MENSGFYTLAASQSHRLLGPTPSVADSVSGASSEIFISNKFSGDAVAAGLETTLGTTLLWNIICPVLRQCSESLHVNLIPGLHYVMGRLQDDTVTFWFTFQKTVFQ